MKFKLGDEVKLVTSRWGDSKGNPIWGEQFGKITGVVITIFKEIKLPWIEIKWNNEIKNTYYESDLELVSAKKDEVIYG